MADANLQRFDKRLRRINKRHRKLPRGYIPVVNENGLIVARPTVRRSGSRFPWKGVALTLIALFAFKGFLYAQLGAITYDERVAKLASGTAIEQAGAWGMQADPVTLWVASQIAPILH